MTKEFIDQSSFRLDQNAQRVVQCLNQLDDAEIWQRPNTALSSIGNLVLHLCGNIRQYAISSLQQREDVRDRNAEFTSAGGHTRDELVVLFGSTVREAIHSIRSLPESEWLRVRSVQGFTLSGVGIVIHVTEHLAYHTGQIAWYTKFLKNRDLGFYSGMDLNAKNE